MNSCCTGLWRKKISAARAQKSRNATKFNFNFILFRMCCESKKARVYATHEIVITLYS